MMFYFRAIIMGCMVLEIVSFGEANKKSDNIRIINLYGQVVIC